MCKRTFSKCEYMSHPWKLLFVLGSTTPYIGHNKVKHTPRIGNPIISLSTISLVVWCGAAQEVEPSTPTALHGMPTLKVNFKVD